MKTIHFIWLVLCVILGFSAIETAEWIFSPREAFGGGKRSSKSGSKFKSRAAFGDSVVAGNPGESFVPFWNASAQNFGISGLRAVSLPGQIRRRLPAGTESVVIHAGTNDAGDGRATGDILGALNAAVAEAKIKGAKRVTMTTNIPRQDIFAGRVEDLASAIRSGSAARVADTHRAFQKNVAQFTIDAVGHLNSQGAKKAGKIVKNKAG